MTPFRREFSVVGTVADLPRISEFVEEACALAKVESKARFSVLMAVDEACSNVFEHAYRGREGALKLSFETRGRDLVVTVRDQGQAFKPEQVPVPNLNLPLEERPIGGLGLHLMSKLMDRVFFVFSPDDGNILVMEKHGVVPRCGASDSPESRPTGFAG